MRIEKFMDFENPTLAFSGKKHSIQGFAIWGELAFILFHTGVCAVYDLKERSAKALNVFKLASYNESTPDNRYTNHANDAMFSHIFYAEGDEFPLLYVTTGNSGDSDEDGFIGRCSVERITRNGGKFGAECVQTIIFNKHGEYRQGTESPAWGWPATLMEGEYLWLYSARYRTLPAMARPDNAYIVTKLALPDLHQSKVILRPDNILDQFTCPFDVFFTQGGTIRDGKLYYLYGAGTPEQPNAMRVYDLKERCCIGSYDLSHSIFAQEEPECCAFYQDKLLLNTQFGRIYQVDLDA